MPLFPAKTRPAVGRAKEALAARYLEGQGLKLVDHNYRCRAGEVDLVMRRGELLVFVEVRFRRSDTHGSPGESVTRLKQRRVAAAAAHYLQRFQANAPCRFDVIAIGADDRIDWIPDAFRLDA